MSLEGRKKLSESCMGRVPWNKGLTKEDPRVFRNISGGSRKTQFKEGERPETKGEGNANWKGGRIEHNGYVYLRRPKHPYNKNNYVQEHRLVIEKHLKRLLLPSEIVHHKDGRDLGSWNAEVWCGEGEDSFYIKYKGMNWQSISERFISHHLRKLVNLR